jgi:hypothetical protein
MHFGFFLLSIQPAFSNLSMQTYHLKVSSLCPFWIDACSLIKFGMDSSFFWVSFFAFEQLGMWNRIKSK